MLTEEEIKNKALTDKLTAFNPQKPVNPANGRPAKNRDGDGAEALDLCEIHEDGSVTLRMVAKGAANVEARSQALGTLVFTDRGDGVFECTVNDPRFRGFMILNFFVDGVFVLNPFLPVCYFTEMTVNYVDIPDPETPYVLLYDVPHGSVTKEIFWSDTMKQYESCLVYTPPGYEKNGPYPVLYLQHGAGENETCWVQNGRLPYILDNVLAEGKGVPFVVVMNDGMIKLPYETQIDSFDGIEGVITEDCRKYIEGKYNVYTDKWHRAIAGLSLGSMQSSWIGFRYPELYSAVGLFSGFMRRRDNHNTYDDAPQLDIMKDQERFLSEYKLFFRSIGSEERMMHEFIEDDGFCAKYGADQVKTYCRKIYDGHDHVWNCWRRALYDFAQLVFQD